MRMVSVSYNIFTGKREEIEYECGCYDFRGRQHQCLSCRYILMQCHIDRAQRKLYKLASSNKFLPYFDTESLAHLAVVAVNVRRPADVRRIADEMVRRCWPLDAEDMASRPAPVVSMVRK